MILNHLSLAVIAGLAVTAEITPPGILSTIAEVGALGVLLTYLWINSTKTMPGLLKAYREETKAEREHHSEQIEKVLAFRKEDAAGCGRLVDELKDLVSVLKR